MKEIISIPISQIKRNNYRDGGSVADLVGSITEIGLIQPISVKPSSDTEFEIIDGHRRFDAYVQVHGDDTSIECIVDADEDNKALIKKMCANFNRRPPSFKETALFIKSMIDSKKKGYSNKSIAKAAGVPPQQIEAYYRYACLDEDKMQQLDKFNDKAKFTALNLDDELFEEFFVSHEWNQKQAVQMVDLVNAPFPLDDKDLHPQGACLTCPFNTDNFGSLFGGSGTCIKISCYEDKCQTYIQKMASTNPYTVGSMKILYNEETQAFCQAYPENFIHPNLVGRKVSKELEMDDLERLFQSIDYNFQIDSDEASTEDFDLETFEKQAGEESMRECDTRYEEFVTMTYISRNRNRPETLKLLISEYDFCTQTLETHVFECLYIELPSTIKTIYYLEPVNVTKHSQDDDDDEVAPDPSEMTADEKNTHRLKQEAAELGDQLVKAEMKLKRNEELEYYKAMDEQVEVLRDTPKLDFDLPNVFGGTTPLQRYIFMFMAIDPKLQGSAREYIRLRLGAKTGSSYYNTPELTPEDFNHLEHLAEPDLHAYFANVLMVASFHHMLGDYSMKSEQHNKLAIYYDKQVKPLIGETIAKFYRDMYYKRNTNLKEQIVDLKDKLEFTTAGLKKKEI